ncbi:MAG: coenzyme-B sulfoethylthiotransferase subunit beta, partial [Candidatus Helarchaeota archaeon]
TGVALMQAISEIFDINPLNDPDGCAVLKNAVFGRYPLSKDGFQPGNPIFGLLREPQSEKPGFGYKNTLFNHLASLAQKRTFDAVIFSSILEQASQFELGNAIGWFERYHLLGFAYQGLNADRVVYDLIAENKKGTVGDVIATLMRFGLEDGIIKKHGRAYPSKLFSGFQFYKANDFAKWNAYTCAGLLAASMVNCGASRAAQSVSSVFAGFSDLLTFESGGLPDPDCGRVMGAGLGLNLYTHSILGEEGDIGSYAMDSEFLRHSSFMSPCIAAAICLDSGTQLKRPETTSEVFIRLREMEPLFNDPIKQICEAAEKDRK